MQSTQQQLRGSPPVVTTVALQQVELPHQIQADQYSAPPPQYHLTETTMQSAQQRGSPPPMVTTVAMQQVDVPHHGRPDQHSTPPPQMHQQQTIIVNPVPSTHRQVPPPSYQQVTGKKHKLYMHDIGLLYKTC